MGKFKNERLVMIQKLVHEAYEASRTCSKHFSVPKYLTKYSMSKRLPQLMGTLDLKSIENKLSAIVSILNSFSDELDEMISCIYRCDGVAFDLPSFRAGLCQLGNSK